MNYYNENGILNDNNYERVSIRSNNEYRVSDKLKFGNNIGLTRWNSNNKPFSLFTDAYNAAPIYNAKNPDGTYGFTPLSDVGNPLAKLEYTDDKTWGNRFMGNFYGDVKLKKNLAFRSSFGMDYDNSRGANYQQKYRVSATQRYDTTTLTQSEMEKYRWIWDNTLTYTPTLKKAMAFRFLPDIPQNDTTALNNPSNSMACPSHSNTDTSIPVATPSKELSTTNVRSPITVAANPTSAASATITKANIY